jgi:hypothetical protein
LSHNAKAWPIKDFVIRAQGLPTAKTCPTPWRQVTFLNACAEMRDYRTYITPKTLMKIYFKDQKNNLMNHLNSQKKKSIIIYDRNRLIEKTTTINIATSKKLSELSINFLFDYKIFPDYIMTSFCQWKSEKRKMAVGDTIVQQAFLPPFKHLSLKIIMGVRINNIINDQKKSGFSYETLEGHIEKGCSSFTIEELKDGKIIFKINTFSKPRNILAQLAGPIISIPYQTFCTNRALQNMKQQLEISAK